MIVFDIPFWLVFQLAAAVVFPLLVGLVTTRLSSAGLKAVILAALAVVTSLAGELAAALQTGATYNLGTALLAALGSFLIAVGTHFGLWKPTGAATAAQKISLTGKGQHEAP